MNDILAEYPLPVADLGDREQFWRMLNLVYSVIVATEPLLHFAMVMSKDRGYTDYLKAHLEEERDHAAWLREDLIDLGREPVLNEDGAILAGLQCYLIQHVGAECLLGYMFVLESRSMPLPVVAQLEKIHGTGVRTLRFHSEHDPDHIKGVVEQIEKSDEKKEMIQLSARLTAQYLAQSMRNI